MPKSIMNNIAAPTAKLKPMALSPNILKAIIPLKAAIILPIITLAGCEYALKGAPKTNAALAPIGAKIAILILRPCPKYLLAIAIINIAKNAPIAATKACEA